MNDSQVRPPPPPSKNKTAIAIGMLTLALSLTIGGCVNGTRITTLEKRVEQLEQRKEIVSVTWNGTNIWSRPLTNLEPQ